MGVKIDSTKGYKYRVLETISYDIGIIPPKEIQSTFSSLSMNGVSTIEKGFCYDGASGGFDTENVMLAALFHDQLCNYMAQGLLDYETYWKPAAALLRRLIIEHIKPEYPWYTQRWLRFRAWYFERAILAHGKLRYGVG